MSAFDRFASRSSDLASFFRRLAIPSQSYSTTRSGPAPTAFDWEQLGAAGDGGPTTGRHLELFDAGLHGAEGADRVLAALERAPTTRSMTLSQNRLGDDGLRALLAGTKQLRSRAIGGRLQELNLGANGLTDVSLHLITLHLLTPSPHPTSLTHLYLTNNNLSLSSDSLGPFLALALSSPASSLACLSLTNNPQIGTAGLASLLSSLSLAPHTSLTQLHVSLCRLTPDAAPLIARWLSDPAGGGTRLQALCANGNFLSSAGLRAIARPVIEGRCSGLLLLELLANEDGDEDEWRAVINEMEAGETIDQVDHWRAELVKATERNKRVLQQTRAAALGLLAVARLLFAGNPHEVDDDEVSSTIENQILPPRRRTTFPFLRLPIEIQVHVLRALQTPSPDAAFYPPLSDTSPRPSTTTRLSPLTEQQFLRLLAYAADRETLVTELRILGAQGTVATLNGFQNGRREEANPRARAGDVGKGKGWEEWMLGRVGCDRFQRA